MFHFEIKKVIKKRYQLIIVSLAFALVLYGNYFADYRYMPNSISGGYQGKDDISQILWSQQKEYQIEYEDNDAGGKDILVGGTPEMAKNFDELDAYKPKFVVAQFDGDNTVHWQKENHEEQLDNVNNPDLPFEYYQKADAFIKKYKLYLPPYLKQDYEHTYLMHQYLDEHQIDLATFADDAHITYNDVLTKNTPLFFGLIPLLLLFFMAAGSMSEEYEQEQVFFNWTLPINRTRVLFAKIVSMLYLALLYMAAIFVVSVAVSLLRGNFEFYAMFPYKVFSLHMSSMPFIFVVVKIGVIFMLKALYFIVLGLAIGLAFKKRRYANVTELFISIFGILISNKNKYFHHFLNPFDVNYFKYIAGDRMIKTGEVSFDEYLYTFIEPNFSATTVWIFLAVLLAIVALCYYGLTFEKRIGFERHLPPAKNKKSLLGWENHKQARFFSRWVIYGLVAVFIVSIFYGTYREDTHQKKRKSVKSQNILTIKIAWRTITT